MRYGVIGAGGVGGYYAAALARGGHIVHLLARGPHLDAIRRQGGLAVRTPTEQFTVDVHASDDPASLADTDNIIVAVKSYSLPDIASTLNAAAARGETIVPLLNGVDTADRLIALGVPRESIVAGTTYISAARTAPGLIERTSPFVRIVVGELDPALHDNPRTWQVASDFRDGGVDATVSDTIAVELWRKFFFIAPMAATCGLARRAVGGVREAPLGRLLIERATREVVALAIAKGIPVRPDEVDRVLKSIDATAPTTKPSFLLDLERGGPTELDLLSGTVSRLARAAGVETPVHDTAVAALSPTGAPASVPTAAGPA
ncbi:MAG TPA: ketopantoate reductase family protein [Gemmatimonadaceae bacterium]|nr:ketopantoate reductase family protein [Gemmatimonadaceae bacterium]